MGRRGGRPVSAHARAQRRRVCLPLLVKAVPASCVPLRWHLVRSTLLNSSRQCSTVVDRWAAFDSGDSTVDSVRRQFDSFSSVDSFESFDSQAQGSGRVADVDVRVLARLRAIIFCAIIFYSILASPLSHKLSYTTCRLGTS